MHLPYVIEKSPEGVVTYDLNSRLLKDRIIFIDQERHQKTPDLIIHYYIFSYYL